MKPATSLRLQYSGILGILAVALTGCGGTAIGANSGSRSRSTAPAITGAQRVVEDYLKAASGADGARMYALIGAGERDDETPETLCRTAADRYSSNIRRKVL